MKSFKVIGVKNVIGNLKNVGHQVDRAAEQAITDEANMVLKEAMKQCPVETGSLRRSGTVGKVTRNAASVTVEIGFHTKYAIYVHENMKAHHPTGKAKFLEDPVNAAVPGLAERYKARLKKNLNG